MSVLGTIPRVPLPPQPLDVRGAWGWGSLPGQRIRSFGEGEGEGRTWPVLEESKMGTKKGRGAPGEPLPYDAAGRLCLETPVGWRRVMMWEREPWA